MRHPHQSRTHTATGNRQGHARHTEFDPEGDGEVGAFRRWCRGCGDLWGLQRRFLWCSSWLSPDQRVAAVAVDMGVTERAVGCVAAPSVSAAEERAKATEQMPVHITGHSDKATTHTRTHARTHTAKTGSGWWW